MIGAFPNFCKLFIPEGLSIIAQLFIAGLYSHNSLDKQVETPCQGVSTVFAIIAPKGRNIIAQGNAFMFIHIRCEKLS